MCRNTTLFLSLSASLLWGGLGCDAQCEHEAGSGVCLVGASNALPMDAVDGGEAACRLPPLVYEANTTLCDQVRDYGTELAGIYRVTSITGFIEPDGDVVDGEVPEGNIPKSERRLGHGMWPYVYIVYELDTPWAGDPPQQIIDRGRVSGFRQDVPDDVSYWHFGWDPLAVGDKVGLMISYAWLEGADEKYPDDEWLLSTVNNSRFDVGGRMMFVRQPNGGYLDNWARLFFWDKPTSLEEIGYWVKEAITSVERGDQTCAVTQDVLPNRIQWDLDHPKADDTEPDSGFAEQTVIYSGSDEELPIEPESAQ